MTTGPHATEYPSVLTKFLPFLRWRHLVTRRTLRADIIAGLTGAIIVLPQGVAFAIIAGLPPEYGLYSAMVPAIIAALFGSSYHLISGPTTAISIVVFSTISLFATPASPQYISMVLTMTFLAGLFQLILGIARLGTLINFVSHSVVLGFTAGAAVLIATSQMSNVMGVTIAKKHSFIHIWAELFSHIPETNLYVFGIAIFTLLAALGFKLLRPRWPGMLFAMVGGSLLAYFLDATEHGVRLVGALPAHLPPLSSPDLTTASIRQLAPAALAVAMLGLTEAVSIARSVATRSEQRIDSNQEFLGQGLSNLVGSFFSSYASSGSFTRTGVNYTAGARTPLAAVFAAVSLAAVLLLIAPLTAYLPIPSMAGILLLVAYNLIDVHHIRRIIKTSRSEAMILIATFLATLFVELEFAIYVGVILSLLLYLNRTSRPNFVTMVPNAAAKRRSFVNILDLPTPECPQLKVVRIDGSIFFGAINHISGEIEKIRKMNPEQCHILVLGSGINFIDVAGCEMLAAEARSLYLSGGRLYLCGLKDEVIAVLNRGGYLQQIGGANVFCSKTEAVRSIISKIDPERCSDCEARIFNECVDMPKEIKA